MSQPKLTNQVRFSVYDGENMIHQTEWTPERSPTDAVTALSNVRRLMGGNYAYRIERTGDSKVPNPLGMVRYVIKVGESVYYSKALMPNEKEAALAQIEEEFPSGEIKEVAL